MNHNKYIIAKKFFEWNREHLTKQSHLDKNDIAIFFATKFNVYSSGRKYKVNYDNYADFLTFFKKII